MEFIKKLFCKKPVQSEMDIMIKSILEAQKNLMDMMIAHNEIMIEREEQANRSKLMKELVVQLDGEKIAESVINEVEKLNNGMGEIEDE